MEERVKQASPPAFDELYKMIKKKSQSQIKEDRKINLPVLISHLKRPRDWPHDISNNYFYMITDKALKSANTKLQADKKVLEKKVADLEE